MNMSDNTKERRSREASDITSEQPAIDPGGSREVDQPSESSRKAVESSCKASESSSIGPESVRHNTAVSSDKSVSDNEDEMDKSETGFVEEDEPMDDAMDDTETEESRLLKEPSNKLKQKIFQFLYEKSIRLSEDTSESPGKLEQEYTFNSTIDRLCYSFVNAIKEYEKRNPASPHLNHELFQSTEYRNLRVPAKRAYRDDDDVYSELTRVSSKMESLVKQENYKRSKLGELERVQSTLSSRFDQLINNQQNIMKASILSLIAASDVDLSDIVDPSRLANSSISYQTTPSSSSSSHPYAPPHTRLQQDVIRGQFAQTQVPKLPPQPLQGHRFSGQNTPVTSIAQLLHPPAPTQTSPGVFQNPFITRGMSGVKLSDSPSTPYGKDAAYMDYFMGREEEEELEDREINRNTSTISSNSTYQSSEYPETTEPPMINVPYKMSRQVKTVPDLYKEWYFGINGNPSVIELNRKYQSRWRSNVTEKDFYYRRLKIINYLEKLKEVKDMKFEEAVSDLEELRKSKNLTLSTFSRYLKYEWLDQVAVVSANPAVGPGG